MSARTERENYSGRVMIQSFREHCNKRKISVTEDALWRWDEKCNNSRIQKSFGTAAEIRHKALRMLYREYLDNYSKISIQVPGEAKTVPGAGIKPDGRGNRRFLGDMDREGLDFCQKKVKAEIYNAAIRAKFYGLTVKIVRALVDEAFQAAAEAA